MSWADATAWATREEGILLLSGGTPSAELPLALGSSVSQGCGAAEASPEEMLQGLLEPLCSGDDLERPGGVQPGVEKALGTPQSTFQHLKGLQDSQRGTLDTSLE